MIRGAFITLLFLVLGAIVIGLFLPRQIVIERDRVIDQPREILFDVMQDFRHFGYWSPWFDHAPAADFRIEGPSSGVGSTLVWADERGSGGGRLWIVGMTRPERVDMQLELGENEAEMYFLIERAAEAGYRVSWGMRLEVGVFDLVGRYAGLLLPRLLGRDYEEGLDRLARYLEQTPGRVPEVEARPGSIALD